MAYEIGTRDGKLIYGADFSGVTKAVDMNNRSLVIVGTNERRDRYGDVIHANGWQLDDYMRNPVFLWAHDYKSVPLGVATKVERKRKPGAHLLFHVLFPPEGLNPFADMILSLYAGKFINASSVGFIPLKYEKTDLDTLTDEERERYEGGWHHPLEFLKQELIELSGCAIPANPDALQNMAKAVEDMRFGGVPGPELIKVVQGSPMPEIEHEDKLIAELSELSGTEIQLLSVEPVEKEEEFITVAGERTDTHSDSGIELTLDDVTKPLPNEHRCRLNDPGKYDRFNRVNCDQKHDGKCIDVIFGIKDNKSEIQALAYKKKTWTKSAAAAHCASRNGKFEAAEGSDADISCEHCGYEFATKRTDEEGTPWVVHCPECGKEVFSDLIHEHVALLKYVVGELEELRLEVDRLNSQIEVLESSQVSTGQADGGQMVGSNDTDRYKLILSEKRNERERRLKSVAESIRTASAQLKQSIGTE